MKYLVLLLALAFSLPIANAQTSATHVVPLKTDTFKVWGNCGMCKKTIEKSLQVDGVSKADWDVDSKVIAVSYDPAKITLDQIQQDIAAVGYDNDGYRGDDKAYADLPGCCQYDRKADAMVKKEAISTSATDQAQPKPTSDPKVQINAVLLAYYEVKNALTKDDGKVASVKAADLLAAIDKVDISTMTAEQKGLYTPLQEKIKSDATRIVETKEVAHQRDHFDTLSDNIWQVVKAFAANEHPAYRQYCPMVKKYWVSGEKAVKNPYYGKQMLACGNVKETLN